ncbi:MAG: pilus assembly protein TadG-related protein [Candidatus Sericytochromatia bacterium]|nr:pilus assembly protein TadG-related protein [Candidatus Sericytochromatia bacterium]
MRARRSAGQALPVLGLSATALMMASVLAWEAGGLWVERRRLQTAADASALAGAAGLAEDTEHAKREAVVWARHNGADPPRVRVLGPGKLEVTCVGTRNLTWARLFGWASASVTARAVGELHCLREEAGLRPWGITRREALPGRDLVLARPWGPAALALVLDGPGVDAHARAVALGARETVRIGDRVALESAVVGPAGAAAAADLLAAARRGGAHPEVVVAMLSDIPEGTGAATRQVIGFVRLRLTRATAAGEIRASVLGVLRTSRVEGSGTRYAVRLAA